MQWFPIAASLWALIVALIALSSARRAMRTASAHSAALARISGIVSDLEATERLTPSKLAELAQVRDAVDKGNALLKRIAARETMRDRRDGAEPLPVDPSELKARLRRQAGLVAGRPANHHEVSQ